MKSGSFDVFQVFNNLTKRDHVWKFENFKGVELPAVTRDLKGSGRDDNMVIVAHVWDDLRYMKSLYLSLVSAYLFTDIENFDVKLFFSRSLKEYEPFLNALFSPFATEVSYKHRRFKYFTTFYDETQGYDFISHLDADLFFCGSKKPFFSKIKNIHANYRKKGYSSPYICFNYYPYRSSEFRVCHHLLGQLNLNSNSEVKKWLAQNSPLGINVADLENWIEGEKWPWNIFYSYDVEPFRQQSFKDLVKWWYDNTGEWWEEEKLYWFWMNNNDYPYFPLKQVLGDWDITPLNPYYFTEKIPGVVTKNDYEILDELDVQNTLKDIRWENQHTLYLVHPFEYHSQLMGKNKTNKKFIKFLSEKRKNLL